MYVLIAHHSSNLAIAENVAWGIGVGARSNSTRLDEGILNWSTITESILDYYVQRADVVVVIVSEESIASETIRRMAELAGPKLFLVTAVPGLQLEGITATMFDFSSYSIDNVEPMHEFCELMRQRRALLEQSVNQ